MSIPSPPKPLGKHCSALRSNTLYTFGASGFQSLALAPNSTWTSLPSGIPTTGGECVLAHRGTRQEALYVVGGTTTKTQFSGLQRYVFGTKKWETIELVDPVAFNLTNHGATFIEDKGQIIVFAGTAWPEVDVPSANTFLISTEEPYQVTSVVADTPLLAPIVLPWGESGAVVIGGDKENKNLNTFDPDLGWKDLDVQLKQGIPARGTAAASFMDGDDGSRLLIMFDLTTSPASVRETQVVGGSSRPRKRQQNQLTAANWPEYNNTLAPTGTRENAALAADGDMVVLSGDDEQAPLLLFNARENAWIDPQDIFSLESDSDDRMTTTSTEDPTDSSTSTLPSPEESLEITPPAAPIDAGGKKGLNTIQILFVVLGSIIGLLLLLCCIYFFLRRSRQNRLTLAHPVDNQKSNHLSFQDRGASFMKEAGVPLSPPSPRSHPAHLAPLAVTTPHPGSPVLTSPPVAARSSGWSRYFSGNSATNLVQGTGTYPGTVRSSYSDSPYNTQKTNQHHPNPFLYNAGPGVAAGGGGGQGNLNAHHDQRRGSDISMSSIGGDSFSSGIPESIHTQDQSPWSPVDERRRQDTWGDGVGRTHQYTDGRRETTGSSRYSGPPAGGGDNLSWLNLRTN